MGIFSDNCASYMDKTRCHAKSMASSCCRFTGLGGKWGILVIYQKKEQSDGRARYLILCV